MREVNIYSERLNDVEQEQDKSTLFIDADPAQYDRRTLRSHSAKELFGEQDEQVVEKY